MLLTLDKIWSKVQEFVGRVDKLEGQAAATKLRADHTANRVDLLEKGLRHQEKITDHQGSVIVDLHKRTTQLEADRHREATKAGIWKAKAKKLEEANKRRH